MLDFVCSADSHVLEPPDLWTTRMQPKYRDEAPRVIRGRTGEFWTCPPLPRLNVTQLGNAGLKWEEQIEFAAGGYAVCRPGGWDPGERLKDMDLDGIRMEIFYCGYGLAVFSHPDPAFQRDAHRAYNDWAAEFASHSTGRLIPIANISMTDPEEDIKELERVMRMGFRGILISSNPLKERRYSNSMWKPFWSAVESYRLPISVHILTDQEKLRFSPVPLIQAALTPMPTFMTIADMLFAGVFERHPDLRVISVESDIGWIADFLRRMDWNASRPSMLYSQERMSPGDLWRRNVYATFQDDPPGVRCRDFIGVDRLMWGSDYPHFNSTFPNSRTAITANLGDIPEDESRRILGGNMLELYGLSDAYQGS